MSPPKTSQLNSTLLSLGIGTGEGMLGSASDRQKPQRQRIFHWSILVDRFSFDSWSLPGCFIIVNIWKAKPLDRRFQAQLRDEN